MKSPPVVAAQVDIAADGVPFSALFDDVYHPLGGALAQARHVFLAGNGLPERWRGRERFVIVETGFGIGLNLLAAWQASREEAAPVARRPRARPAMRRGNSARCRTRSRR